MVALIPLLLLGLYLHAIVGSWPDSDGNLGWPVLGLASWIPLCWHNLLATPIRLHFLRVTPWEWRFDEFFAPVSLLIQATYLAIWRIPGCPVWCLGASFALLLICLTPASLTEHIGSTRTELPLTIVFNLQLARQRGPVFLFYFVAGNLGLLFGFHGVLGYCLSENVLRY